MKLVSSFTPSVPINPTTALPRTNAGSADSKNNPSRNPGVTQRFFRSQLTQFSSPSLHVPTSRFLWFNGLVSRWIIDHMKNLLGKRRCTSRFTLKRASLRHRTKEGAPQAGVFSRTYAYLMRHQ